MLAAGPYRWQAHELTALGVATNRVTFGAYRAPAAPPAAFAVESLIDELARRLGIDPLELRLRNVAGEGDRRAVGPDRSRCSGRAPAWSACATHPLWARRDAAARRRGHRASRSAGGRAGMSRRPRCAGSTPTGG